MHEFPLVSLVIPTLNRVAEPQALLDSIAAQDYANFEVILVDQNHEPLLAELVAASPLGERLRHVRVAPKGAAFARNAGAALARGEVLCFPDDDAELFPDTLHQALRIMRETGVGVVFGKCVDRHGRDSMLKYAARAGYVTRKRYEGTGVESTMVIDKRVFETFRFDETFGVGTFYGASEGNDLVFRMLAHDVRIFYSPEIRFYHPHKLITYDTPEEVKRIFSYRCGLAHFCLRHRLYGPLALRMIKLALFLPYLALFDRRRVRFFTAELLGILTGLVVR